MFGLKVKINVQAFVFVASNNLQIDGSKIEPLLLDILAKLKLLSFPKKASDFKDFVATVQNLKRAVEKIVVLVESYGEQIKPLSSEQKKDLAVEMLDALFEFPLALELADTTIFALLVSFVVDDLNTQFGQKWTPDIIGKIVTR